MHTFIYRTRLIAHKVIVFLREMSQLLKVHSPPPSDIPLGDCGTERYRPEFVSAVQTKLGKVPYYIISKEFGNMPLCSV